MKRYGFNKATEFTKKQVNVIWAKAKNGELKVEKWVISQMYKLADYYGRDDNRFVELCEERIKQILEEVFQGSIERAQELIDCYTEFEYSCYSEKARKSFDRSFVA